MAWDGYELVGFPKIKILRELPTIADMLYQAMDMEKGAESFYKIVSDRFAGTPFSDHIDLLAKAEVGHARLLYQLYKQESKSNMEFTQLYEALSGELLEGGQKLSELIGILEEIDPENTCLSVIELAFAIENSAYELYRNMADRHMSGEETSLFYSIAQAEKEHIKLVSNLLKICDNS